MRPIALRVAGLLAVAFIALLGTGCSSKNTGKIVGKWKVVSPATKSAAMDQLKADGVAMAWEFRADGTFTLSFVPADDSPKAKAGAAEANRNIAGKEFSGKYTLGFGDRVNFTGAKDLYGGDAASTNITINGDNMTMKDSDGATAKLTRIK